MGCVGSIEFQQDNSIPGRDEIAMETFDELGIIKSELDIFFTAFVDIDADNSGYIRGDEFFAYFRIEQTSFNKRLFISMDTDNTGYLNFCEFVCAMWNFLSMAPTSLGSYAYFLFDDDGTGSLDHAEVKKLVETIQHKSYEKNPAVRKLVDQIMTGQSAVSVEHFCKCSRENKALCAPLISLQHEIRNAFLGIPFWIRQEKRRGADKDKSAPGYIQVVIDRLNQKRLKKQVKDLNDRKQQENEERIKQLKGRTRDGRRRTSIMIDFFAKDLAAPTKNSLPATQRKRRSSILTRPSLIQKEKKKVKLPRRNKKSKRGQQEEDELVFEDDDAEPIESNQSHSPAISPRGGGSSKKAERESKEKEKTKKEHSKDKSKKKENPKKIHPTFSDIADIPPDDGDQPEPHQDEEKQSPRAHKHSGSSKGSRYKA